MPEPQNRPLVPWAEDTEAPKEKANLVPWADQPMSADESAKVIKSGSGVKAPMPPLTSSQRAYRMVRPFVAPVVETAGMVGGAVVGAGAGAGAAGIGAIPGGVAGAGLGYGMGKQLMKAGDYNLGGYQPPPFNEQLLDAGKDVIEGAAMETAGPYINKAIGYTVGGLKDAGVMAKKAIGGASRQFAERRAAKIAQEAAAQSPVGNLQDTISMLKGRGPSQTGSQAVVDMKNPTLQALLERGGARKPGSVLHAGDLQEAESLRSLQSIGAGETPTQGRQATEMLQELLNKRTGPIREHAFEMSNMGQLVADLEKRSAELGAEATAQVANVRHLMDLGRKAEAGAQLDLIMQGMPTAASKYTYKGELAGMADKWATKAADASLDLGAGARSAQAGADAMREQGIAPLTTGPIIEKLSQKKLNPRTAGLDVVEQSIDTIIDNLRGWSNKDGIIQGEALDSIRKNSVESVIRRLMPGAAEDAQKKQAAKVLVEIKPVIDEAFGPEYQRYLAEHSAGMQEINKTKLAGKALELWQTNKQAFMDLVTKFKPDDVEAILGPGQYDIAKALTEREMGILQAEARKIATNEQVKSQAARGHEALGELMKRNIPSYKFPFLLNWKVSAANQLVGRAEGRLSKNVLDQLAEASTDPAKLQSLLERIPPSYKSAFLNAMKQSGSAGVASNRGVLGGVADNLALGVGARQATPAIQSYLASGAEDDGRQ